jgi:hypothetical protein
MSLAGNMLGGATALANGATWAQTAGVMLGGSGMLTGAARTLSRLPGLRDTELAEVADHFTEGAMVRQVARPVPAVGRIAGPVVGATLLSDRHPDHAYTDENGRIRQPMLVPAVGKALSSLTRGEGWERKGDEGLEGTFEALRRERVGTFTPISPIEASIDAAQQKSDYSTQEGGEEMEQHLSDVARSVHTGSTETGAMRLESAGNRLEHTAESAADSFGRAADALERAARVGQQQAEGRLNVAGSANIATVMGDVIALLRNGGESAALKGMDNFTVAHAMAQSLGVEDVGGGKPPIENDLTRYGMFVRQALDMGLNDVQTANVVREVKESPDARLLPETRDELVTHVRRERNLPWEEAQYEVERVEHAVRLLPNEITAYGTVNLVPLQVEQPISKDNTGGEQ